MKCYYYVEDYEENLFDDEGDACEFIGEIEDVYTDESLQQMCEERIYEICGLLEIAEYCEHDDECIAELYPGYLKQIQNENNDNK